MKRTLFPLLAALAVCLAGPASAAIMVTFSASGNTSPLQGFDGVSQIPATLDFTVGAGGVVSLDATTPGAAAAGDAWDSPNVGTVDASLDGTSFTLSILANQGAGANLQVTANGGNGGLGVQGRNQWRIDDTGNETVDFTLDGSVELTLLGASYENIVQGSVGNVGNTRIEDADTQATYLLPTAAETIDVSSDGYVIGSGETLTFTTHGEDNGDLNGVPAASFAVGTQDTRGAGGSLLSIEFDIVGVIPEPTSGLLLASTVLASLVRRRV